MRTGTTPRRSPRLETRAPKVLSSGPFVPSRRRSAGRRAGSRLPSAERSEEALSPSPCPSPSRGEGTQEAPTNVSLQGFDAGATMTGKGASKAALPERVRSNRSSFPTPRNPRPEGTLIRSSPPWRGRDREGGLEASIGRGLRGTTAHSTNDRFRSSSVEPNRIRTRLQPTVTPRRIPLSEFPTHHVAPARSSTRRSASTARPVSNSSRRNTPGRSP